MQKYKDKPLIFTVFLGSIFAIWIAVSIASNNGLQRILGLETKLSFLTLWTMVLKSDSSPALTVWFSNPSILPADPGGGLRVSKQMMPSKQSSKPSLLRTRATCRLSALVKICNHQEKSWNPQNKVSKIYLFSCTAWSELHILFYAVA